MIDPHGRPAAIRRHNGPELTSQMLTDWCKKQDIELRFIQPGKPDQNACIERLNRTNREAVLSGYLFDSLDEVREITPKSGRTTRWAACARRDIASSCSPRKLQLRTLYLTGKLAGRLVRTDERNSVS